MMSDPQYPIGKFAEDPNVTPEKRQRWIEEMAGTAELFRKAVAGLTPGQLDTAYRSGGWTVRQVVHHMADSHANLYIRFRLALTESDPTIKGYDTAAWGELADAKTAPVEISITLLDALHQRCVLLLQSLAAADFAKTFRRPDGATVPLDRALQMYVWHGRHHAAQITTLREQKGWK
jgi:uncharacterized damage-inducible protein DinB